MASTRILFSVLRVCAFVCAVFPITVSAKILELPHREVSLPNGLRVFLVRYPTPNVAAYQIAVHAGSRNEVEYGKTGFAHFFEHLMFRGTKNRSAKEFGDLYTRLGCENNAWTWFDMTDYHGVVSTAYLPQILAAEADRFQNLEFEEKVLRDEAGAVLGEYNKSVAQPEFALEEKLMETAFTKHPYGHTTMGYKQDVLNFTERYRDVWPFFKRHYRPGNVSIVIVGDIQFNEIESQIKKLFGAWRDPKLSPLEITQEPTQTAPRSASINFGKPVQTRITVAYKVPAFNTRTTDAASLQILAETVFSVTSDFQKTYRFEKKWLDDVTASPMEMVDPGLWTINLRLSQAGKSKERELLEAVEQTIDIVRKGRLDFARVAATKQRFENAAVTSWFGSAEHLAGRIAWYTNFESDLGVLDRIFERLSEVTPEHLREYANRHLVDSGKTVIVLRGE